PGVFVCLRLGRFHRRIIERRPEVAGAVGPVVDRMLSVKEALCHGDYSPKNILTHSQGFTLVDYETAHLGDPTMDLGFFLSHLMLKAIKRHAERERYFELTRAFWRGYGSEVHFRSLSELMWRGIGHFGLCVLARIDGSSPVDYLTEEPLRDVARRLGRTVLREGPPDWEQVLALADPLLSL